MLSSVNSCQKWQAVTFPPNGLIWVTGRDPKGLLEEQGNNMIHPGESWFEVNWHRYLVAKVPGFGRLLTRRQPDG